jgi:hypothetical protein
LARGLNKNASTPAATHTPNMARCNNAAADTVKPSVFGGAVLAEIDWSQPWFTPWRDFGEPTARQALQQQSVAEALNALQENPRQQTTSKPGTAVERHSAAKREASAGSGGIASAASVNTTVLASRLATPTPTSKPEQQRQQTSKSTKSSSSPNQPYPTPKPTKTSSSKPRKSPPAMACTTFSMACAGTVSRWPNAV